MIYQYMAERLAADHLAELHQEVATARLARIARLARPKRFRLRRRPSRAAPPSLVVLETRSDAVSETDATRRVA
jgi:hypothetical protein